MILTKRFVFIHLPKTGGTFVTHALKQLHNQGGGKSLMRRFFRTLTARLTEPIVDTSTHGTRHDSCSEIPASHRDRPIVSAIRNPYDRHVSMYYFRQWDRRPDKQFGHRYEEMRRAYPHFPNVTFAEFMELMDRFGHPNRLRNPNVSPENDHGWLSTQFVMMYFKNPREVYPKLDDAYIASGAYKQDMYPVHFLRTESLNRDLYDVLLKLGYPRKKLSFILDLDRVNVSGLRADNHWERHYTPALKAWVRRKEHLIFSLFPEFDESPELRPLQRSNSCPR